MTTYLNLIISLIIIILIIVYKITIKKKNNEVYKKELYSKTKKLTLIMYIVSILMFFISLIMNFILYGSNPDIQTTITYIINSLSISILFMPISLSGLYEMSFKDEEKISHIKTLATNDYNPKIIKKLNRAGINVIILTKNECDTKIKQITEPEIERKYLSKNLIIKTDNLNSLNKLLSKETTLFEFNNIDNAYEKIYKSRGVHDNYIRTLKYLATTYIPLFITFFFLNILGFPIEYNILLVIILKLFTIIIARYLYRNLPYDTDIMYRQPKDSNILLGKQELSFTILESLYIFFILNAPYMFVLSQGGTQAFGNTLFYLIFIYSNLFMTYSYISESNFTKNIFKSLKNIRIIIFTIACVAISLIFNFTTYFDTRNIELHNFISCILFGVISILLSELIKFARYTTTKKGKKKHENKNNRKR